jgi:hypothetical protein
MTKTSSIPGAFIIESNQFDDENSQRLEGRVLKEMLALSGRPVQYRYIRTKQEFKAILGHFHESRFRYLHLACHGRGLRRWSFDGLLRRPKNWRAQACVQRGYPTSVGRLDTETNESCWREDDLLRGPQGITKICSPRRHHSAAMRIRVVSHYRGAVPFSHESLMSVRSCSGQRTMTTTV